MNMRNFFMMLVFAMALTAPVLLACAQEPGGGSPPAMEGRHMRGPAAMCADQQYLYVMVGGKLMKYGVNDLKVLKTVDLPVPVSPADAKAGSREGHPHGRGGPPPMGGAQMVLSGDRSLIVMAGPKIYRYSTADLTLQSSVDLPKPEAPSVSAGSN
jgi:hypothetical protein